jgi:hypothetical protein
LPELETDDIATVTVTDLNGKIALVKQINASAKINHNLATGLYLVTIHTNTLDVTQKLIIK